MLLICKENDALIVMHLMCMIASVYYVIMLLSCN